MLIFPAIDLIGGEAVRLYQGDYAQKTVFSTSPLEVARDFRAKGASFVHLVDLDGAKSGTTPHLKTVVRIKEDTGMFCEIGGGIRSMETVKTYIEAGLDRVILGTAAVKDPAFLDKAVQTYGEKIAVGVDLKDGFVAVKGWTETTSLGVREFFSDLEKRQVRTVICTDVSKDGAMKGTNRELYRSLKEEFSMDITASGGVSSLQDIRSLKEMGLYGAIIGKAYYTGALSLKEAIEVAES